MNVLYNALVQTLRKQYGANSRVVPFALGRVYECAYRNWKHDPSPLVFIVGSDAFHTIGINIHYVRGFETNLIQFIMLLRNSQALINGLTLYQLLKTRIPMIPQLACRMYFTAMLRGRLVSDGISQIPSPNVATFIRDPWVRRLNNLIRPRIFSFRKTEVNPQDAASIRSQAIQTQYNADAAKPFANRNQGNIVQYLPPEEGEGNK
jgi:hypothetical protein